jgi:hypothetical protein
VQRRPILCEINHLGHCRDTTGWLQPKPILLQAAGIVLLVPITAAEAAAQVEVQLVARAHASKPSPYSAARYPLRCIACAL